MVSRRHSAMKKWSLGNDLQFVSMNKHRKGWCYGFNAWNIIGYGQNKQTEPLKKGIIEELEANFAAEEHLRV